MLQGIYSSHNDKNYFEIAYSLNRQFGDGGIYKNIYTYNFVDNHDVNRLASVLKNPEHLKNVYTLLFTMPGAPSIYYGSEWGLPGVKENGSDWNLRPCLDLHNPPEANQELCRHIDRLSRLKETCLPLQTGDYRQIVVKNEQLVYRREAGGQVLFTALNLSGEPASLSFGATPGKVLVDVLNHQAFSSENGSVNLPVEAYSARILMERDDSESAAGNHGFKAPPMEIQRVGSRAFTADFKGHEYGGPGRGQAHGNLRSPGGLPGYPGPGKAMGPAAEHVHRNSHRRRHKPAPFSKAVTEGAGPPSMGPAFSPSGAEAALRGPAKGRQEKTCQ